MKQSTMSRQTKRILLLFIIALPIWAQHQVTLSWNWQQGSGDPATGFNVKRGNQGGPYQTIAQIPASPTSFIDQGTAPNTLTAGNQYCYIVTATGPGGESTPSNETCVKIPASPPAAPTNLTGQAQ